MKMFKQIISKLTTGMNEFDPPFLDPIDHVDVPMQPINTSNRSEYLACDNKTYILLDGFTTMLTSDILPGNYEYKCEHGPNDSGYHVVLDKNMEYPNNTFIISHDQINKMFIFHKVIPITVRINHQGLVNAEDMNNIGNVLSSTQKKTLIEVGINSLKLIPTNYFGKKNNRYATVIRLGNDKVALNAVKRF